MNKKSQSSASSSTMILEEQSMQLPLNPENLLFWGELQLLNSLQQKRLKSFSQSTGTSFLLLVPTYLIYFILFTSE
jgi:hypothetical protein